MTHTSVACTVWRGQGYAPPFRMGTVLFLCRIYGPPRCAGVPVNIREALLRGVLRAVLSASAADPGNFPLVADAVATVQLRCCFSHRGAHPSSHYTRAE